MSSALDLVDRWAGPYGGLPPFDRATPELIERAVDIGIARKRTEIAEIASNPDAPTFANTVEAVEDAGRSLRRADTLRAAFASTRAIGTMPEVEQRLSLRLAALEDEIAHDDALFARVDAVYAARGDLLPDQARLTQVLRERMLRRGAGLPATTRAHLADVNGSIARAQALFQQNMIDSAKDDPVFVETESELDGVPEAIRVAAAKLAAERDRPGTYAICNMRPTVWPVLQLATNRALRRRVRDMWMNRCNGGAHDTRAIIAEIAELRAQKARLHGYSSFADWSTAGRMAGTPQAALDQLLAAWRPVRASALERRAELQALADADGLGAPIEAWDWLYYSEKLRQVRFGLDAQAVKPYLALKNVRAAMFDAAGRLHGLAFRALPDAPAIHPDVTVYEVSREGQPIGVIWFDLLVRDGKMRSSWQLELRPAETFREPVIAYSNVCSNLERPLAGPVLMGWEYANVLFHEFGHALHMLLSSARYPSLGPMGVEWDLVELPAQLNERWLYDRDLIHRHFLHHETEEPMPDAMIDAIFDGQKFDRAFSVGVEYLAPAIVDMRLYMESGDPVDPVELEARIYAEIGMPPEIDPIFRIWNQYHSFTDVYAAGLYVYLWADVMVSEVIEAFTEAPGGLYDAAVATRWRDALLSVGTAVPGQQAFREFRGRDPDPRALLRRFELA